ncbi:MAG: thioredoxin family protein [Candidatus Aureabacteria bacterium]|nr:thioredoxin family protein [Candidatus Auribacterota bacterium]
MRSLLKNLIQWMCLFFLLAQAVEALEKPVRFELQFSEDPARLGERYHFKIKAAVKEGWHVYANPKGPGTGIPLTVTLEPFSEAQVIYPEAERFDLPQLSEWVMAWKEDFMLSVSFYVPRTLRSDENLVKIHIEGMACERACYPIDEDLSFILPVPASGKPFSFSRENNAGYSVHETIYFIFLSVLAGFCLNFMPCVLPVLSLKVLSVVTLEKRKALQSALLYSLGVLMVFMALASVTAFAHVLWGQQFQYSGFIISMGILLTLFILSLFEIIPFYFIAATTSAHLGKNQGRMNDFFKGILATLLATPCSGPFLGGTLFWTSRQHPWIIFTIYFFIGTGMVLPFILIVLVPGFRKWLPKPGPWMLRFKEATAFIMMGTLVYLLSLLSEPQRLPALSLFLLTAFFGWFFSISPNKFVKVLSVILFSLATAVFWPSFHSKVEILSGHQLFSIEKVQSALGNDQVVVVDFTADWCPNCKLNEKWVLQSGEVQDFFKEKNILFLTADITRKNREAEEELKKRGGYAVPFLAVYLPGNPMQVETLPDVYTKQQFFEFMNRLLSTSSDQESVSTID